MNFNFLQSLCSSVKQLYNIILIDMAFLFHFFLTKLPIIKVPRVLVIGPFSSSFYQSIFGKSPWYYPTISFDNGNTMCSGIKPAVQEKNIPSRPSLFGWRPLGDEWITGNVDQTDSTSKKNHSLRENICHIWELRDAAIKAADWSNTPTAMVCVVRSAAGIVIE